MTLIGVNILSAPARAAAVLLSGRELAELLSQKHVLKTVLWFVCLDFVVLILFTAVLGEVLQCQVVLLTQ